MNRTVARHEAIPHTDFGLFAKRLRSDASSSDTLVDYAHRDSYYIFGMVETGTCRVSIDFREQTQHAGDCLYTLPNQVHRIVRPAPDDQGVAFLLFVDQSLVPEPLRHLFDVCALGPAPFTPEEPLCGELLRTADMILRRMADDDRTSASCYVLRQLAGAFIGMLAEALVRTGNRPAATGRRLELALAFKRQLEREEPLIRNAAHYAQALCISPAYLNEIIRTTTGLSVSRYLRDELVLRAKRLLIGTTLPVGAVAERLGVNDAAYFTRLFTQATGMSPTRFRQHYRV